MKLDLLEDLLAFAFVAKSSKRDICPSCGSDLEADGSCLVCEDELEENDDYQRLDFEINRAYKKIAY